MTWGTRRIAGTVYDLTHLDPFTLRLLSGGRSYALQVSFGAHTFTRDTREGDKPDLWFMDGNNRRSFCINRYGHSLSLPAAVRKAVEGQVCWSRDSYVLDARLPGLESPYLVVFNIEPAKSRKFDARMRVRSAHPRPNLNPALPYASFRVVVACAINGHPVRWAKK